MRISTMHMQMRDACKVQGPLTDPKTGLRIRANRSVQREWRLWKRNDAIERARHTTHDRTKAHRLGRCGGK